MSAALTVWVKGIGLWAPGTPNWHAFLSLIHI